MSDLRTFILLILSLVIVASPWAAQADNGRMVIDMRGREVRLPADLKKVAAIDDGSVEGVMTHLGVTDKGRLSPPTAPSGNTALNI
jgi:iron complex transport system substrate-binding protein